ncbi:amidophosphoribosyltransferase [bacterium]|nr:amidophosphoribosyltransferase [bacterium]
MCGIVGIIGNQDVGIEVYESLICLQHRGQDSAGISTYNKQFHLKKGLGLVRDVFDQEDMDRLKGNIGIGQLRYPTVGGNGIEDSQPFILHQPYGISMVHNGNVYNFHDLKKELFEKNQRHINSNCDLEVILHVFAHEMSKYCHKDFFDSICKAVEAVHKRVKGGYSVIAVIAGKGIVAFRDPHGIRPLIWGKRDLSFKEEHIFASEGTMLKIMNFEFHRDVEPGEVVFVDLNGEVKSKRVTEKEFRPCIFEYVYFARPDSVLNKVSVYRARLRMCQNLAKKIKKLHPDLDVDIVVPAPESAATAALSCAHELRVRYTQALVKNHFIGRTFIMPGQKVRRRANQFKLSPLIHEIKGKNILIVDDSIVRGNVSRHIVKLLKDSGAKKVYFASASPPLRYPDLFGIDLPTSDEYIAFNKTEEEIRQSIGADILIYQDIEDLVEAVTRRGDLDFTRPHTAYFNGDYPVEGITPEVLADIEKQRKEERASHGNIKSNKLL